VLLIMRAEAQHGVARGRRSVSFVADLNYFSRVVPYPLHRAFKRQYSTQCEPIENIKIKEREEGSVSINLNWQLHSHMEYALRNTLSTVGDQAQVCFCQEILNLTGIGGPRHRYYLA
jgi:hypothetical protein